jgi:hypothetical protein
MDAVDYIRQARPQVVEATPQEAAAIKASFERQATAPPGRFRAFLRRLSRGRLTAWIIGLLIVPTAAYAVVTQVLNDRSDQVEQALERPQNEKAARSLIEKCRELEALGTANEPCLEVLRSLEREKSEGGAATPDP